MTMAVQIYPRDLLVFMVENEADLANIPNDIPIGSTAYVAGMENAWQLNASRQWVAMTVFYSVYPSPNLFPSPELYPGGH